MHQEKVRRMLYDGGTEKSFRIFKGFLMITAIALGLKYIFVDFGIDAEFQISMSYRLAKGDVMFKEMWEPVQTSAFLCAFFIKIYLTLFHTTTGIVLYLQVLGILVDGTISYLLYRVVSRHLHCDNAACIMAWIFFVVSPKDVPIPDYANMQVWFSVLLCLTLFLYYENRKRRWIFLSAVCLWGGWYLTRLA